MSPDRLTQLRTVRRLVETAGHVELPSHGYSMYPVIRPQDRCRFAAVRERELAPGDIVLFDAGDGELVGHRMIGAAPGPAYLCKGDTNLFPDRPIVYEQIIGKLVWIERAGGKGRTRRIRADSLPLVAWGRTIRRLPRLSALLRKWAVPRS